MVESDDRYGGAVWQRFDLFLRNFPETVNVRRAHSRTVVGDTAGTPQTDARDIYPRGRIVTSLQHRGAKPTGSARRPKEGFARPSPRPPRDRGAETGGI